MKPMPKNITWKSPKYRKWVSTLPCMVCNKQGPSDPHHVRIRGNAGIGQKPSDFFCIPLCHHHHNEIHQKGSTTFEQAYQVSLPFLVMMVCHEWIMKTA